MRRFFRHALLKLQPLRRRWPTQRRRQLLWRRHLSWRRVVLCFVAAPAVALLLLLALLFLWPFEPREFLQADPSGELQARDGHLLAAFLNPRQQWCFARLLPQISPRLINATLAAEDRRFWQHPGVDPFAIIRAAGQNLHRGAIVSGASTLPMQLIKLRDAAARGKNARWGGKLRQIALALRLTHGADKSAILNAYLNNAPYGQNIVGCEAAALRYFGKTAAELTLPEAALLAGLPKDPTGLAPLRRPQAALRRRNWVLARMLESDMLDTATCRQAQAAPLGASWHAYPQLALHVAQRYRGALSGSILATTLDPAVQARVEQQLADAIGATAGEISNGAALVADPNSGDILAWVGSPAFFDTPHQGQLDAARAPRSPGSALKPFIFALAMRQQQLYPAETLCDAPLDYGLYAPENFDRTFRGLIPAGEALRRSLNIPAIAVLERAGIDPALSFLRTAGLTTLDRSAAQYGLGLALGNVGVRLDELTNAYAQLAALGTAPRLHLSRSATLTTGTLLSADLATALFTMLEQPLPGESRQLAAAPQAPPRVAWKTGTSTGHHDAWAFVFNRQYVVGVWLGNNDGRPSEKLIGGQSALPLAARIFRTLPAKSTPTWPSAAGTLRPVQVCAVSGLPVSPWCREQHEVLLPRSQFLLRACALHQPGAGADAITEVWPATARHWDLAHPVTVHPAGDLTEALASANPAPLSSSATGDNRNDTNGDVLRGLRIIAPAAQSEFMLTGAPGADRVRLATSLDATTALHWYLNEQYLGASTPQHPLLLPLSAGRHQLTCVTPTGLSDQVAFTVATLN